MLLQHREIFEFSDSKKWLIYAVFREAKLKKIKFTPVLNQLKQKGAALNICLRKIVLKRRRADRRNSPVGSLRFY